MYVLGLIFYYFYVVLPCFLTNLLKNRQKCYQLKTMTVS